MYSIDVLVPHCSAVSAPDNNKNVMLFSFLHDLRAFALLIDMHARIWSAINLSQGIHVPFNAQRIAFKNIIFKKSV